MKCSTATDLDAFEVIVDETNTLVRSPLFYSAYCAIGEKAIKTVFINPNSLEIDNLTCFRVEKTIEETFSEHRKILKRKDRKTLK